MDSLRTDKMLWLFTICHFSGISMPFYWSVSNYQCSEDLHGCTSVYNIDSAGALIDVNSFKSKIAEKMVK